MTAQPEWRRPANCARNACIEVAALGDEILIRNSKSPGDPAQRYTREEFANFVAAAKDGQYDDLA